MADDKEALFADTEEELEALGFTKEEIASLKKKVMDTLSDPAFADALASGEMKIALTVGEFADGMLDSYALDDFDWDAMTPEVRTAMEELYYSEVPPTIH